LVDDRRIINAKWAAQKKARAQLGSSHGRLLFDSMHQERAVLSEYGRCDSQATVGADPLQLSHIIGGAAVRFSDLNAPPGINVKVQLL
jgi:hypothetical protein